MMNKLWNELSIKEKADMMRVAIRNGITNLADIRAKYNEFALGGNLYDDGGPKKRITADGRTLTYATVPSTGQVRWVDLNDSKDFDGVTGYRWYDENDNMMNYTQYQEAEDTQEAVDTQEPSPTVEDVDNYVRARGYNPDFTRFLWPMRKMREEGLQGVHPEFDLLTGGRGLLNGAVDMLSEAGYKVLTNPWVDAGISSYFGAHIPGNFQRGEYAEAILNAVPFAGFGYKGSRAIYNAAKDAVQGRSLGKPSEAMAKEMFPVGSPQVRGYNHTLQEPPAINWAEAKRIEPFKSELDWSPESWFGTRKGYGYTDEDKRALSAHIPEYIQIEQLSKADGTWLKMPDGSTWTGDPRSWVQLMSEDGKKLMPERWLNGVGQSYVRDTPTYTGEAWLGDSPVMAVNWSIPSTGGEVFELTYPVSAKLHRTNANGNFWHSIPNREGIKSSANDPKVVFTDDIVEANINRGYDVTRIDNVIEGMSDGLPMADVIIHPNTPRKSLLGNNGNFDLLNKNIYRGLVPFLIGGTAYGISER